MLAPEDNINFNKNSAVYENRTYKQFEKILTYYKYWELIEVFILFIFIFGNQAVAPYLIDILLYFQGEYNGLFLYPPMIENYGYVVFLIFLVVLSYQVFKSVENQRIGARFYIFQSLKVLLYICTLFNLLFFFAFIGLLRIVIVLYYSKTKSFK